jgi:hypothetical protein
VSNTHRKVFTPDTDVIEIVTELDLSTCAALAQPHNNIRVASMFAAQLIRAWSAKLTDFDGICRIREYCGVSFLLATPPTHIHIHQFEPKPVE